MGPRPVVFDMDGVLVDSEPLFEQAFTAYVQAAGRPDLVPWFARTLGRRREDFLPELAAELGHAEEEVGDGIDAAFFPLAERGLVPMPGVVAALERIDGDGERQIALASSSRRTFVDLVLDTLGIAHRFDAIATGEEVPDGKPAPDVYLLAAERLGVSPGACWAVEDTAAGLASAKAAGMRVIVVPNALTAVQELGAADHIVSDLGEVAALVLDHDHHQEH